MNLRSELLEVFGPEVGHALSISSWERLEEWVKRKLSEAQAATVERCAKLGDEEAEFFNLTADTGLDRIRCNAAKEASHRIATAIRALTPDPGWLDRQIRSAYIEGVKSVYVQHDHVIAGVCGAACPLKLRDLRVAELERQLGALSAVTL
jgi:hypothetical protein